MSLLFKFLSLILFSSIVIPGFSQIKSSTNSEYPLISFRSKPKFFITLDKTGSFVAGKGATTNEIRIGLEFKKKLRLGIGFAALVSDVVAEKTIKTQVTQVDSVLNANLSLAYFSMSGEYIFYNSKRWQITMPVTLGIGSSYFNYFELIDGDYKTKKTDQGTVVLFGPTGVATYRILRWVGVSGGVGFRYAVVNNSKVKESFNSPIYLIRLRIFLGEIYKSVFPRGLSGKRNPPYSNEYWD
ncbi:MAG: hypothetical protein IPP71_04875 [Bacteroidetes bacterium]|nr:hypothetical protein [Bacteroidota bacterium]